MLRRFRDSLASMPEEVWFFLRIAAYAIFIGTIYWFLTYEAAGTMLLYGFGLAAGFGTIILGLGVKSRRRDRPEVHETPQAETSSSSADIRQRGRAAAEVAGAARGGAGEVVESRPTGPDGPFGDERGRLPGASVAPIVLGAGVAIAALGLVFGPWLILAGLAIGLVGAVDWGRSAAAEYHAVEAWSTPDGTTGGRFDEGPRDRASGRPSSGARTPGAEGPASGA